ncbi:MAG: ParA family protein [Deltaproteobacteria bacterium]|jgi:chromosome partitioning protein|nr:ParA family protein [Deltaproteobacteria bacterium]
MKVIALANNKGGVGKTSILVHFAFHLHEKNIKVLVIDLDSQANASYTLSEFDRGGTASDLLTGKGLNPETIANLGNEKTKLALIKADDILLDIDQQRDLDKVASSLHSQLDIFEQMGFKYVLLDTGPAISTTLTTALCVATDVISPIELGSYSIKGVAKMVKLINNIKAAVNPKLNFVGMLPSRVNSQGSRHKELLGELNELLKNIDNSVKILAHSIYLRPGIAEATDSGQPVWALPKHWFAGREMKKALDYIMKNLSK